MELNINSTVLLNNGMKMPLLGIGTYLNPDGETTRSAIRTALEYGYRLIDTASVYGNERGVGLGIKDSHINRDELFVTTKLWRNDFSNPREGLLKSLKRLNLDYVDLYLIHWPFTGYEQVYLELEKLQKEGLCKSIGVSNFKIHHIQSLIENGAQSMPQVNQTELHPQNTDEELVAFCRKNKITVEAYSPLGGEGRLILDDPRLIGMRNYYKVTASQILLRWLIQRGIVAIPKSEHVERILENSKLFDFELSNSDIETISDMNSNDRRNYDPDKINETDEILFPKVTD